MEAIIKDIINADKEAREKIERIEKECSLMSVTLQEQRVAITKEQETAANKKKIEYKEQLEKELAAHQKEADKEFDETSKTLCQLFEKEKDSWINEIYNHCLGSK